MFIKSLLITALVASSASAFPKWSGKPSGTDMSFPTAAPSGDNPYWAKPTKTGVWGAWGGGPAPTGMQSGGRPTPTGGWAMPTGKAHGTGKVHKSKKGKKTKHSKTKHSKTKHSKTKKGKATKTAHTAGSLMTGM